MENSREHEPADARRRLGVGVAYWIFAAIGVVFLVIEHREHVYQYLPYALLIACPLLHLFAHREHGAHGTTRQQPGDPRKPSA